MPVIYDVTIVPSDQEHIVTWTNLESGNAVSFNSSGGLSEEEALRLWRLAKFQLPIGRKLFRFLDGEQGLFREALDHAATQREVLHIHLRINSPHSTKIPGQTQQPISETFKVLQKDPLAEGWPFELLSADNGGSFLLPRRAHLIRRLSDWGKDKTLSPENRPLKLLFMASSVMGKEPVLDFELEEETIYNITHPLPMEVDVEDSGSLEGLRRRLEREYYDVVHLSGHTGFSRNGNPYIVMENEIGEKETIYPHLLWNEALIENPPGLLFISGCSAGDTAAFPSGAETAPFARQLIRKYRLPHVLAWAQSVKDQQAVLAAKTIYQQLCRGRSILTAVQQARATVMESFRDIEKPVWPMLQLFGSGIRPVPMVTADQKQRPQLRRMKYSYLENSRVKVLAEGFIGRRRQLQQSLRALKKDLLKVGALLLGTGGLGKSCLAGKICERFTDHTLIIVHGRLNTMTLETALENAFIKNKDETGRSILRKKEPMTRKLATLCASVFKEKNYLLLLDDFEQNMDGAEKGNPGSLLAEAEELLRELLRYLPATGKMTQMIITCRYDFPLSHDGTDLVSNRLEKVRLTGFRKAEQYKKRRMLPHISQYSGSVQAEELLAAGKGNPRLMEWLDVLTGQMQDSERLEMMDAIRDKQEEFIRSHLLRRLLKREGKRFELFMKLFSIYRQPVQPDGVALVMETSGLPKWQAALKAGIRLGLVEYDALRDSYQVTPLLKEELAAENRSLDSAHRAAYRYYKKQCDARGAIENVKVGNYKEMMAVRDAIDPVLGEELIYHALACGQYVQAARMGGLLVFKLLDGTALQEARRIGLWILSKKKGDARCLEDALVMIGTSAALQALGDIAEATRLSRQIPLLLRELYDGNPLVEALALNAEGIDLSIPGNFEAAAERFQQALPLVEDSMGDKDLNAVMTLNNLGRVLAEKGEHHKALETLQKALKMVEEEYEDMPIMKFATLNNIAGVYESLGQFSLSIDYYQESLKTARSNLKENHPQISLILNNIGSLYNAVGDHAKAVQYLEQALSADRALYEEDNPAMAFKYHNLGNACLSMGDYDRSIQYHQQAYDLWKKGFGKDYPKLASPLNNIGEAKRSQGDLKQAVRCFREALTITEAARGKDHSDSVATLNNLGICYIQQGNFSEAIQTYNRVLTICGKTYGDQHPLIATALGNLGEAYREDNQLEKAGHYFQASLKMSNDLFGADHHDGASVLNNLGSLNRDMNHYEKALDYYHQALALWRKAYGEVHLETANTLFNIGLTHEYAEQFESALDFYLQSLAGLEKIHKNKHTTIAVTLDKIAVVYFALEEYEQMIPFSQAAVDMNLQLLGEKNGQTATSLINLGLGHRFLNNYAEAVDCLSRGLEFARQLQGDEHPDTATIMGHLGMSYLGMGDAQTAEAFLEKAVGIVNRLPKDAAPKSIELYAALALCREALTA